MFTNGVVASVNICRTGIDTAPGFQRDGWVNGETTREQREARRRTVHDAVDAVADSAGPAPQEGSKT